MPSWACRCSWSATRSSDGRWWRRATASWQPPTLELDEDTGVAAAPVTEGVTVTREAYSFYQGDTADQPITAFDVGADADLLVWVDFGERSIEIPELPLAAAQISFWPDRSSNANDLRQNTGSQQPLYRRNTAGSNARPATDFDGVNDRLTFASNIPGEQLSIFAYCRRDSSLSTGMSVINTEEYTLRIANATTDEWAVGAGGGQNLSGSTIATGSFVLLEAICNAFDDIDMYQNGVFQATGTLAATGNGFASSAVGAEPGTAAELNGRVAEVIVLDRAVNDTDRQAIESYFVQKYSTQFSRWNNGVTPYPAIIRRDQDGNIL